MDLFDTNIFLIDRFFTRDERHIPSKKALEKASTRRIAVGVFTWIEFLGIVSFNVNSDELAILARNFEEHYQIAILYPINLHLTAEEWLDFMVDEILMRIERRMTYGDATLLWIAEQYNVDQIVTWNPRHFSDQTSIPIMTPSEYLQTI